MVVLLDVDGTLIDSNDAHAQAWVLAGERSGKAILFEDARPLIGMGGDKVLPKLTGIDAESERGKQILELRGEIFRSELLAKCKPFPRSRELLERMKQSGHQLVVATSASEQDMDAILERANVADLIDERTSSDDAENSKPDPDIVLAALKKAKADAESAVMIGDTPYDVAAARAAKVRIVGLRCGGWSDAQLRGAVRVYEDPEELLAVYAVTVFGPR